MDGKTPTLNTFLPRLLGVLAVTVWAVAAVPQTPPPAGDPSAPAGAETPTGQTGPDDQKAKEAKEEAQPKPRIPVDLSSPRAAMRTFLLAVQEASGDHPERIEDAVACLDISELEGDDPTEAARPIAHRLHSVIDKIGVKLDDIPSEPAETSYVFYRPSTPDGQPAKDEISLALNPLTGHWKFTPFTLTSIRGLEEAVQKQVEPPKPTESNAPPARRSPRATMGSFLDAMNADPKDLDEAVLCLDPTGQDSEAWTVRGRDLAVKLKNVMDKTNLVVLSEVPDTPDGEPYVWHTGETGNIVIGPVVTAADAENKWGLVPGEWRFTPQTIKVLDKLYDSLEEQELIAELQEAGVKEDLTLGMRLQKNMPPWLRTEHLGLEGWQWVGLAALLLAGWMIKVIVASVATFLLWGWFRRKKIEIDRETRQRALRSSGIVATMLFWWGAIDGNLLGLSAGWLAVLLPVVKFGLALTAVWVGYRIVDVLGGHFAANKEIRLTQFDDVLIPLLRKILRIVVLLVVVLVVLAFFGKPPATILGALGIGGLALAFAAKDTLGNFFGSITVLLDRPFGIGDWICVGDVDGTVERVGFRSTRVRTFYNSVITIPNSRIVDTQVDNYGVRRFRRTKTMISVTYSTPPEKIDAFCEGIRELIRLHPYTRKDYYHVYLNQFAASSLDILVYVFFEAPDWSTELRERHRLFIDIIQLARKLGVDFAFPTQTLMLERAGADKAPPEGIPPAAGKYDPDKIGHQAAAAVFTETYGEAPPPRGPVVIDTSPRSQRSPQG